MNTPTKSPTKRRTGVPVGKPMDFFDALKQVLDGKRIHKLEWEDKEYYGFLKDGNLLLHKPDGKEHYWVISDSDMWGDDYVIL